MKRNVAWMAVCGTFLAGALALAQGPMPNPPPPSPYGNPGLYGYSGYPTPPYGPPLPMGPGSPPPNYPYGAPMMPGGMPSPVSATVIRAKRPGLASRCIRT